MTLGIMIQTKQYIPEGVEEEELEEDLVNFRKELIEFINKYTLFDASEE